MVNLAPSLDANKPEATKTCSECGATCCYLTSGLTLSEGQINEIMGGCRDYPEKYSKELEEIFVQGESGFIKNVWGRKALMRKDDCGGYSDGLSWAKPCIFLYKELWSVDNPGYCMIWPHRPDSCKPYFNGSKICDSLSQK